MQTSKAYILMTVLFLLTTTDDLFSQELIWIGGLGERGSFPHGVSADGRVVVGNSSNADDHYHAFRWEDGEMIDLGTLGGDGSNADAVSADGSVIVGWSYDADDSERAYRWENGEMLDIGTLGGTDALAYGVSADGNVIVGSSSTDQDQTRAFRWVNGVMQNLGTLSTFYSEALAVSPDGSVVVGSSPLDSGGRPHAVRWMDNSMQDLGIQGKFSRAVGFSADGSVVVGVATFDNGQRAFRWTSSTGMVDLGTFPGGNMSEAMAVSDDGSIVVGRSYDEERRFRAFRWTELNGMENLQLVYEELLVDGSFLILARAISSDGRFIVGYGYNGTDDSFEGYILDTQGGTGTYVESHTDLPTGYLLEQNYPNPFNPSTVIRYQIPEASHVVLEVYNMLGHRVAVLADGHHVAGSYNVDFKAAHLSSGLYIYRMRTANFSATRKLTLLR